MKSLTKLLSVLVGLLIAFWVTSFMMIDAHEAVHAEIYDDYHVTYKITNNLNPITGKPIAYLLGKDSAGYTQVTGNYSNCDDFCKLAQNNNEAFGYNISALIGAIFMVVIFFVFYRFIVTDDFKEECDI